MLEATYLYTTPTHVPVARKTRTTDKHFRMAAARFKNDRLYWKTGKGCLEKYQPEWADRLLFNLPVLLDALKYGEPVTLVEGERDALALNTILRVPATTSHLGAKKFTPAQAEWFLYGRSSMIHIVRDNDEAGAWCAWERYATLVGVGVKPHRIRLWVPARASDVTEALESVAGVGRKRLRLRPEDPEAIQRIHKSEGARLAARQYTKAG